MKKQVLIHTLIYGLCGGVLIVILKLIEFRFLVVQHSVEIYGGLVALVFAGLGIWLGLRLTRRKELVVVKEVTVPAGPFTLNESSLRDLGITRRELEILGLIANGLSNREIAEKLFVSENTVKTHSSRLFDKLNVKRRTQAVQVAKERGLIPYEWPLVFGLRPSAFGLWSLRRRSKAEIQRPKAERKKQKAAKAQKSYFGTTQNHPKA